MPRSKKKPAAPVDPVVDRVTCGCGRCAKTFERERRKGPRRKYAPDCPLTDDRIIEARRKAHDRAWAKRRQLDPRYCLCGCGRVLPRYVRFHPECPSRIGHEHNRTQVPDVPRPKRRCEECCGQPWRRHARYGCGTCHQPYEPEKKPPCEPPMRSALGFLNP